jgi:carbonic anhydrase
VRINKITSVEQIPLQYRNTPIEELIKYQNLNAKLIKHETAKMLIGMCMDNRKQLRLPENFAYILRTGGGNLRFNEFKVSYAIAIGKVKYIALIAHNHCGMVGLVSKREQFIEGLCTMANWDRKRAEEHFMNYAPMFEIDNEVEFSYHEAKRLSEKYPGIIVVPMMYTLEDNMLSFIEE